MDVLRLYAVREGPHRAFAARVRSALEADDRAGLRAWLGIGEADPPSGGRPLYAEVLSDGPIRQALRRRVRSECLDEVFAAPAPLFDDRLREEAPTDPAVRLLVDDPSLPFYLRAPGEVAGRAAGAARRAAADKLAHAEHLAAFVAALRSGDGEVVLAQLG